MGIMGVPESAVSGNASETPDSESGLTGNPAAVENPNDTIEEVSVDAETEGLVVLPAAAQRQVRERPEEERDA